jgi:hypothetical protein
MTPAQARVHSHLCTEMKAGTALLLCYTALEGPNCTVPAVPVAAVVYQQKVNEASHWLLHPLTCSRDVSCVTAATGCQVDEVLPRLRVLARSTLM